MEHVGEALCRKGGWDMAGALVAKTGVWPSVGAGGPELAEIAVVAKHDWVAETGRFFIWTALVSTGSIADAPQRRHYTA